MHGPENSAKLRPDGVRQDSGSHEGPGFERWAAACASGAHPVVLVGPRLRPGCQLARAEQLGGRAGRGPAAAGRCWHGSGPGARRAAARSPAAELRHLRPGPAAGRSERQDHLRQCRLSPDLHPRSDPAARCAAGHGRAGFGLRRAAAPAAAHGGRGRPGPCRIADQGARRRGRLVRRAGAAIEERRRLRALELRYRHHPAPDRGIHPQRPREVRRPDRARADRLLLGG